MKPKRQNKQKDILFLLISSFIVVVAWIGFNLYHITVTSTVSQTIQMQLSPISATFDQATIEQLKTRENIVPVYNAQTSSAPTATASAATPTPISPAGLTTTAYSASGASQLAPTNTPVARQGQ